MRFFTGVMVWGSIIIVFLGNIVALGFCGYRLYFAYHDKDDEAKKNIFQTSITPYFFDDFLKQSDTWLAFTAILGILFLIITCLFIFLRKVDQSSVDLDLQSFIFLQRIQIAIALIEEGSKAVGTMFSSLLFPIIPYLFQLVSKKLSSETETQ